MASWYYRLLGEEFGPVEYSMIESLVEDGMLAEDDDVRDGANGAWKPLRSIKTRSIKTKTPQPAPIVDRRSQKINTEYFCETLGQELGPLEIGVVREMLTGGTLQATDRVKKGANGPWKHPADFVEFRQLVDILTSELPAAPQRTNNPPQQQQKSSDSAPGKNASKKRRRKKSVDINAVIENELLANPTDTSTPSHPDSPASTEPVSEGSRAKEETPADPPPDHVSEPPAPVETQPKADTPRPTIPQPAPPPRQPTAVSSRAVLPKPSKKPKSSGAKSIALPEMNAKTGAIIGVIALVAVIIVGMQSGLLSFGSAQGYIDRLEALRAEMRELQGGTGSGNWDEFLARAEAERKRILSELDSPRVSHSRSPDGSACRTLLFAVRDDMENVLKHRDSTPHRATVKFDHALKVAQSTVDGTAPPTRPALPDEEAVSDPLEEPVLDLTP